MENVPKIVQGGTFINTQVPCSNRNLTEIEVPMHSLSQVEAKTEHLGLNSKTNFVGRVIQNSPTLCNNKIITDKHNEKRKKLGSVSIPVKKVHLCEEEIINIKQTEESSDSEIDIEVDSEEIPKCSSGIIKKLMNNKDARNEILPVNENETNIGNNEFDISKIKDELSSLNIPKSEVFLTIGVMNNLEKFVLHDFFPKKQIEAKSTEVYLVLRSHIISKWKQKQPNYVTRADIQESLSESYDKNTLNRIHSFLEQIGAINYGCGRVRYIRPLNRLIKSSKILSQLKEPIHRRKLKKKFVNNGEGGCTVSHGQNGEILETTVINEDPSQVKPKVFKKPPTNLFHCKPFVEEYKFKVTLDVSTLLLMDFHAHSSLNEVMGLIGGFWDPNSNLLSISHYEPCRNLASSNTHCDMCPISQATSAEKIHNVKLDLIGWFHSHPTFIPEPSQQDLDTQQILQKWIGYGKPCVGVILSPFYRKNVLISSDYRCMIVEKLLGDTVPLPYKFKVEIRNDKFDLNEFVRNISSLHYFTSSDNSLSPNSKLKIRFSDPYVYDNTITYLDKFISSMEMTLQKYFPNDEHFRREVIKRVREICFIT